MAPQGASFTSSFSEFLVAIFSYQFFRKKHPLLQVLLLQAENKALDTAVATFGATSWAALPMDCTAFSMWSWAPLYQ